MTEHARVASRPLAKRRSVGEPLMIAFGADGWALVGRPVGRPVPSPAAPHFCEVRRLILHIYRLRHRSGLWLRIHYAPFLRHMLSHNAHPIICEFFQETVIVAGAADVVSGQLFSQLRDVAASISAAQSVEIVIRDPEPPDLAIRHPWMRVPQPQLDEFRRSPFICVRELGFLFQMPWALSLLFDLLSFMPNLRSLEVVSLTGEDGYPDMPDFEHPSAPLLQLERLEYSSGLGLQTLTARVVSPAATTLQRADMFWAHNPKSVPQFPFLPGLRELVTNGIFDDAARLLLRQCPALKRLQIFMFAHEQLDDVFETLRQAGACLRDLRIVRRMDDFDDTDARDLCDRLVQCKSLQKVSVLTKNRYEASAVAILRANCHERRIRIDFRSGRQAAE